MFVVVVILGLTGCGSNAAATAETPAVKQLEAAIAGFAENHSDVISAAGGYQPGACADRVLGLSDQARHTQKAYVELFCSSVSGTARCPTASSSAGIGAAVATLAAGRKVTAIAVDDENDEDYTRWINNRFPANLRHLENYGPRYGEILNRRVLVDHHC